MDLRKGVVVSRTNLIDSKKEAGLPWKGISLVVFVTLALWGGAFFYHDYVQKKTYSLQQQLTSMKSTRDPQKIATVADSQSRLNAVNSILAQRVDWNGFFKKLEENTIPEVTFMTFQTKNVNEGKTGGAAAGGTSSLYQISLKGTTMGLNNLAKQIEVFKGNKNDKTVPLFSKINIEKVDIKKTDSGQVDSAHSIDFTLQGTIDPLQFSDNNKNNNSNLKNQ